MKRRAIVYCHWATHPALSPIALDEICDRYAAEELDATIVRRYQDFGANADDRAELKRLLRDLQRSPTDYVIVYQFGQLGTGKARAGTQDQIMLTATKIAIVDDNVVLELKRAAGPKSVAGAGSKS